MTCWRIRLKTPLCFAVLVSAAIIYAEVRAKDNGYESVEVIDDGGGIDEDSFDSLCKPHSTSKLSGLNDFSTLSTLGFRGEALHALCALSSVTIITKTRSSSLGTKLRFDHSGNIAQRTSVARSIGTTVIFESLFETLPVRRKELERTAKKEFGKVLSTVQTFALSRPDCKFVCSNIVGGKRQQQICTPGNTNIRDVIISLFGGQSDKNKLVDITRCLPSEDVCAIYGVNPKNTTVYADFDLNGFVSSCEHGFGRCATDRQFIYVNHRPVDCPKICRLINEVYQQYNRKQYPTIVLNIDIPPNMVDVNVTPDKRTVFFEHEKELLALIRSSFLATFHPLLGACTSVEDDRDQNQDNFFAAAERVEHDADILSKPTAAAPLPALDALCSLLKSKSAKSPSPTFSAPQPKKSKTDSSTAKQPHNTFKALEEFAFKPVSREKVGCGWSMTGQAMSSENRAGNPYDVKLPSDHNDAAESEANYALPSASTSEVFVSEKSLTHRKRSSDEFTHQRKTLTPLLTRELSRGFENCIEKDRAAMEKMEKSMDQSGFTAECNDSKTTGHQEKEPNSASCGNVEQTERSNTFLRPQQTIPFSMSALRERLAKTQRKKTKEEQASQELEFHTTLEPTEGRLAEEELKRTLKKSNFQEMAVIGQFNKGFIITRLRNHLFIIDQHASDEKYNFERFQKKARVETQKLIHPQLLDIGAVQASVLRDNLNIFEANGFGFKFTEDGNGCTAAFLISAPVLHSWQFDKSDIEEILAMVTEFPGVMYRPEKLRRIFASRACRKSVMIGTTLSMAQMQTIVHHLGTLDQPWVSGSY